MSSPAASTDVLIRGLGMSALSLAHRCAAVGYPVTVIAEDAYEADRLAHLLSRRPAGKARVTVRTEDDALPQAQFVFSLVDLAPSSARYCLTVTGTERMNEETGPKLAIHLHAQCAEVAFADVGPPDRQAVVQFFSNIGLPPVVAEPGMKQFPGVFLLDRFNALADKVLLWGAVPWEVDEALEMLGFSQGVFLAQDQVGLGPVRKDEPLLIRDRMVREGRLGRAVGVGWYRYPGGGGAVIDPLMEDMIVEEARFARIEQSSLSKTEVQDLLMLGLACTGAEMLQFGTIADERAFETLAKVVLGAPDILEHIRSLEAPRLSARLDWIATLDSELWNIDALKAWLVSTG